MKRVIIFSTAYLPLIGGAELAVREITDRISDFKFDLICARLRRDLPRQEKIGNVNVWRIGFGNNFDKILLPLFGFLKAKKLVSGDKRFATSDKPLLWGVMASWGSLAAFVYKLFYPRVPFLLTLQEGDAPEYIEKGRLGMVGFSWKLLLQKTDFVQVISNYLADMARKYGYKGKMEVVPNGVDLDKYQALSIKYHVSEIKTKLNIRKSDKIIISVSRLVEKNGINDLIEAFNLTNIPSSQFPVLSSKLLIIGSGPLERQLKAQARKLNLEKKVLFFGDIPNEKVPQYLAISDIFCRPSLSEGLGTAFLEAMAMSVPVVATPVGGIPDFLQDNETGLFCKIKNPQDIAKKIKILSENHALREKIIGNARKMIEEKYNWDNIARKIKDIFSELLILKNNVK